MLLLFNTFENQKGDFVYKAVPNFMHYAVKSIP